MQDNSEIAELDVEIQLLVERRCKAEARNRENIRRVKLQEEFLELVEETTQLGYDIRDNFSKRSGRKPQNDELTFCGYLIGDYSERGFSNSIIFSGGFVLRSSVANIIFDPSNGTIRALYQDEFNFDELDGMIVSHYHPTAAAELHNVFNILRGDLRGVDPPAKSKSAENSDFFLFSTAAVLNENGRNGHPSLLIPFDRTQIGRAERALPNLTWYIMRIGGGVSIGGPYADGEEPAMAPDTDALVVRTFPACHDETIDPRVNKHDIDGITGRAVSCFHIRNNRKGWSILYTGDTEYNPQCMPWLTDGTLRRRVDVLIANTKTIEYLSNDKTADYKPGDWEKLRYTENQLGWRGTLDLTRHIQPRYLVIRALGLECVVRNDDGNYKYAPDKLAIYQESMESLLKNESGSRLREVIIPGRHRINLEKMSSRKIEEVSIPVVRAFWPYGPRTYGDIYITDNEELIRKVDDEISRLANDPDFIRKQFPFLVIDGAYGGGKTLLAEAIGREVLVKKEFKDTALDTHLHSYDLATAHATLYESVLFGIGDKVANDITAKDGLLSKQGVLILNNLDSHPQSKMNEFLDILETYKYQRVGETTSRQVQPIIIFTYFGKIEEADNLSAAIINRLKAHRIRIQPLSELSDRDAENFLGCVIDFICRKNDIGIDDTGLQLLTRDVDWSDGELRSVRNVFSTARELAKSESGPYMDSAFYHVTAAHIRKALENNKTPLKKKRSSPAGWTAANSNGKIPESLAWIIAEFLSYGGILRDAKLDILSDKGKSRKTNITERTLNDKIGELKPFFAATCFDGTNPPDKQRSFRDFAKQFDEIFFHSEALKAIRARDVRSYMASLDVERAGIPDFDLLGQLFINPSDAWLAKIGENLQKQLYAHAGGFLSAKEKLIKKIWRQLQKGS